MKIIIYYSGSWRNSFLDGSNNEKPPKRGRKYIASSQSLKKAENYKPRKTTHSTVMGVLNRLIGDQRKLYQSKEELYEPYYFNDLDNETSITFHDNEKVVSLEVVRLHNMNGNFQKQGFVGLLKSNTPLLDSEFSNELWGVLGLEFDELCDFIINDKPVTATINLNAFNICDIFDAKEKIKPLEIDENLEKVLSVFKVNFPTIEYRDANNCVNYLALYSSALYLQLYRLSVVHDTQPLLTSRGVLSGIGKKSFTGREFLKIFAGGKKPAWSNPYDGRHGRLKKVDGVLEITIDVERDRAKEIKTLIMNAGVGAFPMGKKGLAYLKSIKI